MPITMAPSPVGDEVSGVGDAGSELGPEEDAGAGEVGEEPAGEDSGEDVGGTGEEDVSETASDVVDEGTTASGVGDGTTDGVTVVFGSIDTSQVCTSV